KAGGEAGRVYRYIGRTAIGVSNDRDDVDLSTEDYSDTDNWVKLDKLRVVALVEGQRWSVVAPDGATYVLALMDDGRISVSRNTINAISAAASLAAAFGGSAAPAIAGAGAVAQNVILTTVNAQGVDSVIDSAADVTLDATSTSTISSIVAAASI